MNIQHPPSTSNRFQRKQCEAGCGQELTEENVRTVGVPFWGDDNKNLLLVKFCDTCARGEQPHLHQPIVPITVMVTQEEYRQLQEGRG